MRKFILISVTFFLLFTFILSVLFFSYMHPSFNVNTVNGIEIYETMGFVISVPNDIYLSLDKRTDNTYFVSFSYDLGEYQFQFDTFSNELTDLFIVLNGDFRYSVGSDVIGDTGYKYSSVSYDVQINVSYDRYLEKYLVISVYIPLNSWNMLSIFQNYTEYLKENFPRFPTMSDNVEITDYLKDVVNVFYYPNELVLYVFDIFGGLNNILGGELVKGGEL